MKKLKYLLFLVIFINVACTNPTENPANKFPEKFVYTGSDQDTSYTSLKTVRNNNGTLRIEATGWGISECGLYLSARKEENILSLYILGFCGTVPSYMWVKTTFPHQLTIEEESYLTEIRFIDRFDTLVVRK